MEPQKGICWASLLVFLLEIGFLLRVSPVIRLIKKNRRVKSQSLDHSILNLHFFEAVHDLVHLLVGLALLHPVPSSAFIWCACKVPDNLDKSLDSSCTWNHALRRHSSSVAFLCRLPRFPNYLHRCRNYSHLRPRRLATSLRHPSFKVGPGCPLECLPYAVARPDLQPHSAGLHREASYLT